jgi:hypothetical protein
MQLPPLFPRSAAGGAPAGLCIDDRAVSSNAPMIPALLPAAGATGGASLLPPAMTGDDGRKRPLVAAGTKGGTPSECRPSQAASAGCSATPSQMPFQGQHCGCFCMPYADAPLTSESPNLSSGIHTSCAFAPLPPFHRHHPTIPDTQQLPDGSRPHKAPRPSPSAPATPSSAAAATTATDELDPVLPRLRAQWAAAQCEPQTQTQQPPPLQPLAAQPAAALRRAPSPSLHQQRAPWLPLFQSPSEASGSPPLPSAAPPAAAAQQRASPSHSSTAGAADVVVAAATAAGLAAFAEAAAAPAWWSADPSAGPRSREGPPSIAFSALALASPTGLHEVSISGAEPSPSPACGRMQVEKAPSAAAPEATLVTAPAIQPPPSGKADIAAGGGAVAGVTALRGAPLPAGWAPVTGETPSMAPPPQPPRASSFPVAAPAPADAAARPSPAVTTHAAGEGARWVRAPITTEGPAPPAPTRRVG